MKTITNPILPGFHPDPSIARVGDDYYIATSTFEWFPGVLIHHSRDLVHWRLASAPLDRTELLDMTGNPPSGGVWAPCLTYSEGLFYLVYSDSKTTGRFKDVHNYVTTAPAIEGPWTAPVYLNSTGFDPSFFHDDDGKTWLLNMKCDFRPGRNRFAGILLQEYDKAGKKLTGSPRLIFTGTALGWTEGPHMYRRNGWYYLMTAEGGTGLNHAVTVARSSSITGPWEVDPENPIITSADAPAAVLQKAGHGCLVETQSGEPYLVHLCSRPIARRGRSVLGRETAIQKMTWTPDGWLRLASGGRTPEVTIPAPDLPAHPWPPEPSRDDFDRETLPLRYQFPRAPLDSTDYSLTARPGFLRLYGAESPTSRHHQVLVARRIQALRVEITTCLEFVPGTDLQMAGLILLYDTETFYYLRVSYDEKLGKVAGVLAWDKGTPDQPGADAAVEGWSRCHLRAVTNHDMLTFSISPDGKTWTGIGPILDMSRLSDEYCAGAFNGAFTGAFVGLTCQDFTGRRLHADYDFLEYREIE